MLWRKKGINHSITHGIETMLLSKDKYSLKTTMWCFKFVLSCKCHFFKWLIDWNKNNNHLSTWYDNFKYIFYRIYILFYSALMTTLPFFRFNHFLSSSWRRHPQQDRHIPVTWLSASLLTPWLFPEEPSCPLDSMSLSSREMANYQKSVCWKDTAMNYICLETVLRSKHILWNKLPSEMKCIQKNPNASRVPCDFQEMPEPWLTWKVGVFFPPDIIY